jgi:hypothetical protein
MKLQKANCYRCEYGCNTFTVDVDEGVTPFMIKCKSKSKPGRPLRPDLTGEDGECVGTARSCFYPKEPLPSFAVITHEWYRPKEMGGLSAKEKEHVERGGLLLRERTEAMPVFHKDSK